MTSNLKKLQDRLLLMFEIQMKLLLPLTGSFTKKDPQAGEQK